MHYCGMMGKLNGTMSVTHRRERQSTVNGSRGRNETAGLDNGEKNRRTAGAPGGHSETINAKD